MLETPRSSHLSSPCSIDLAASPAHLNHDPKMYRRQPTRIEVKMDDLQEYEALKKEWDDKKTPHDKTPDTASNTAASKPTVHERIGYKPEPRIAS